jgi:hypothetical protein
MTMLQPMIPTSSGRSRYRSGDAQWPHVGECTSTGNDASGMVEQRDGGRVSAAGDAR